MIKSEISARFVESLNFLSLKNLATPGGRTMHPETLIMEIHVVQNYIYDNFYFDHKTVWSNQTTIFL